jgi:uncharacterized Zn-binding protein involved in type VI secretion
VKGLARRRLDSAGGTQAGGHQNWFLIDGEPVVVIGDPVEPHGPPVPHDAAVMAEGLDWFTLDGKPACRAGHAASCGHATTGADWVDFE